MGQRADRGVPVLSAGLGSDWTLDPYSERLLTMTGRTLEPVRLLVVREDADVRGAFALVLDDEGYETRLAATLEEALGLLGEHVFAP